MPFYATKRPGDHGVFPQRPPKPVVNDEDITPQTDYSALSDQQLIALCDEREIKSPKGTPVGRHQKRAYYLTLLKKWDRTHVNS